MYPDIDYFMKIQNAYGTKSHSEKELAKVNSQFSRHFNDTFDCRDVLKNGKPYKLMVIKDTDNNTYKKKIKSRNGDFFNVGDIITLNSQQWIVTALDPDDKTWNSGYMWLCTILLSWQNKDGEIIQRWCFDENLTKYSSGIKGNNAISTGDFQYGLKLPYDKETINLKRDRRFVIDSDLVVEPDVYILTNREVKTTDYSYFGRGNIVNLTLSYDALNKNTDKLISLPNGSNVWICDYNSSTNTKVDKDITAIIEGGNTLRCGRTKSWEVTFKNKENIEITDCPFSWNILSDFTITETRSGNTIQLKVDDEEQIGASFILQVTVSNTVIASVEITIVGGA